MKTKLRLAGKAVQVFRYLALLARYKGHVTVGTLPLPEGYTLAVPFKHRRHRWQFWRREYHWKPYLSLAAWRTIARRRGMQ